MRPRKTKINEIETKTILKAKPKLKHKHTRWETATNENINS